jgi:predicted ester cyclase
MSVPRDPAVDTGQRLRGEIDRTWEHLRGLLGVELTTDDLLRIVDQDQTVRRNKEALLRFQKEVFNGHDWSIETLSRHLTPDFLDHAAMQGDPPGFEGVQLRFSAWQAAFEDSEEDNVAMVGEGDMLAVLYDLHAKHEGAFMGVQPTHREVVIPGIEFLRLRDGKIAEHWGIYDFLTTAEEIGADLTFVPREQPGDPRRTEIPWRRGLTPEDAQAAESYLTTPPQPQTPPADGDRSNA